MKSYVQITYKLNEFYHGISTHVVGLWIQFPGISLIISSEVRIECLKLGVTQSTIIATIHCSDVGYCLFRNPLVTHISYHLPCLLL